MADRPVMVINTDGADEYRVCSRCHGWFDPSGVRHDKAPAVAVFYRMKRCADKSCNER